MDNIQLLKTLTDQMIEITRTVMSLAHEVKMIDERVMTWR